MAGTNVFEEIEEALRAARTIAVVGCSPTPSRPSHSIASYLKRSGFEVFPVNPYHSQILSRRCYPDLTTIPQDVRIDIVDVFRRSEFVPSVAEAAVQRGIGLFFMQDGVVDLLSARRLNAAGIAVAMDRCIYRDLETLRLGARLR